MRYLAFGIVLAASFCGLIGNAVILHCCQSETRRILSQSGDLSRKKVSHLISSHLISSPSLTSATREEICDRLSIRDPLSTEKSFPLLRANTMLPVLDCLYSADWIEAYDVTRHFCPKLRSGLLISTDRLT
jgi:hypothetical protein